MNGVAFWLVILISVIVFDIRASDIDLGQVLSALLVFGAVVGGVYALGLLLKTLDRGIASVEERVDRWRMRRPVRNVGAGARREHAQRRQSLGYD